MGKCILGIDPGLAFTGYGVIMVEGSRYHHISHGVIKTQAKNGIGLRFMQIQEEIQKLIETYIPVEAGIESLYFYKNSKSAIPVAQASGVILVTLARAGIPFGTYTPLELKQAVIGYGKAEKRQVQEMLKILFNMNTVPEPDHAADALAAAICQASFSAVRERLGFHELRNV